MLATDTGTARGLLTCTAFRRTLAPDAHLSWPLRAVPGSAGECGKPCRCYTDMRGDIFLDVPSLRPLGPYFRLNFSWNCFTRMRYIPLVGIFQFCAITPDKKKTSDVFSLRRLRKASEVRKFFLLFQGTDIALGQSLGSCL